MEGDPVYFATTDSAGEAAQAFERYDLISAPVVNLHRQVVGWVKVEQVVNRLAEDTFKQSLSQVGLSEDIDLFAPIGASARNRWIWLGLNLFTAFIASRVIGVFEGSIAQLSALAALMPIVASIGGNTGNQTVALVIRGIALSQLNESNRLYLLRKEVAISTLNGLMWGFLMGVVTLLLYGSLPLAGVMRRGAARHSTGKSSRTRCSTLRQSSLEAATCSRNSRNRCDSGPRASDFASNRERLACSWRLR